jgi:hypothetical protein
VEEDGGHSGTYPRHPPGAGNVAALSCLAPLVERHNIPLTLLVTHAVATRPESLTVLEGLMKRWPVEIGAHLHPWSTPPFIEPAPTEPLRSRLMPADILAAKLDSLSRAIRENLGVTPRSFRMGRFDWCPGLLSLLPGAGFWVDSSMVPGTQQPGGADHYLVPCDPFAYSPELMEAPVTMQPLWPAAARGVYRLARPLPERAGLLLKAGLSYINTAGAQPVWFPLVYMKQAARLHQRRGGQVVNMFFHSTELMPGATPHLSSQAAVDRLLKRITGFADWLAAVQGLEGAALSDLRITSPPNA